jgi:hypothetical protein
MSLLARSLIEQARQATVEIYSGAEFLGSGFFLEPHLVVTCAHVVWQQPDQVTVKWREHQLLGDVVVRLPSTYGQGRYYDPPDLAFISVADAPDPPLARLSQQLAMPRNVVAFGFSQTTPQRGVAVHSLNLEIVGPSGRYLRVKGDEVPAGMSGSLALDPVTGLVCGVVKGSVDYQDVRGGWLTQVTDLALARRQHSHLLGAPPPRRMPTLAPEPGTPLHDLLSAQQRASERMPYRLVDGPAPPLSAVYVRQRAAPRKASDAEQAWTRSIREVLRRHRHALVVGGPGAGKSALVQRIVGETASWWLSADRQQAPPFGPLLTLRLPATAFRQRKPWLAILTETVQADLSEFLVRDLEPSVFDPQLSPDVEWLLLVDGLDEVVDPQQRTRLVAMLADQIAAYGGSWRFLVTSRPLFEREFAGLSASLNALDMMRRLGEYELRHFDLTALSRFAQAWFTVRTPALAEANSDGYLVEVDRSGIDHLVRVPLLATISAVVFETHPDRPLPISRAGLYREFVFRLLYAQQRRVDMWEAVQAQLAKYSSVATEMIKPLYDHTEQCLEEVAHRWLAGSELTLVELAIEWLRSRTPVPEHAGDLGDLVQEVLLSSGLVALYGDDLRFIHRGFAEYLAAGHTTRDGFASGDWLDAVRAGEISNVDMFRLARWAAKGNDVAPILLRLLRPRRIWWQRTVEYRGGPFLAGSAAYYDTATGQLIADQPQADFRAAEDLAREAELTRANDDRHLGPQVSVGDTDSSVDDPDDGFEDDFLSITEEELAGLRSDQTRRRMAIQRPTVVRRRMLWHRPFATYPDLFKYCTVLGDGLPLSREATRQLVEEGFKTLRAMTVVHGGAVPALAYVLGALRSRDADDQMLVDFATDRRVDPVKRIAAARVLAGLGTPPARAKAYAALRAIIEDERADLTSRCWAASACHRLGDTAQRQHAADWLTMLITTGTHPEVWYRGAAALARLGLHRRAVLPLMTRAASPLHPATLRTEVLLTLLFTVQELSQHADPPATEPYAQAGELTSARGGLIRVLRPRINRMSGLLRRQRPPDEQEMREIATWISGLVTRLEPEDAETAATILISALGNEITDSQARGSAVLRLAVSGYPELAVLVIKRLQDSGAPSHQLVGLAHVLASVLPEAGEKILHNWVHDGAVEPQLRLLALRQLDLSEVQAAELVEAWQVDPAIPFGVKLSALSVLAYDFGQPARAAALLREQRHRPGNSWRQRLQARFYGSAWSLIPAAATTPQVGAIGEVPPRTPAEIMSAASSEVPNGAPLVAADELASPAADDNVQVQPREAVRRRAELLRILFPVGLRAGEWTDRSLAASIGLRPAEQTERILATIAADPGRATVLRRRLRRSWRARRCAWWALLVREIDTTAGAERSARVALAVALRPAALRSMRLDLLRHGPHRLWSHVRRFAGDLWRRLGNLAAVGVGVACCYLSTVVGAALIGHVTGAGTVDVARLADVQSTLALPAIVAMFCLLFGPPRPSTRRYAGAAILATGWFATGHLAADFAGARWPSLAVWPASIRALRAVNDFVLNWDWYVAHRLLVMIGAAIVLAVVSAVLMDRRPRRLGAPSLLLRSVKWSLVLTTGLWALSIDISALPRALEAVAVGIVAAVLVVL